jgi:hypothetical protein
MTFFFLSVDPITLCVGPRSVNWFHVAEHRVRDVVNNVINLGVL